MEGRVTEREKDKRDLAILKWSDAGMTPAELAEMFDVPAPYVVALIMEAEDDPS